MLSCVPLNAVSEWGILMQNLSTIAFVGALACIGAFAFKLLPAKQAILLGGGLLAVGFITQPATTQS
jgi:hypothetical protein